MSLRQMIKNLISIFREWLGDGLIDEKVDFRVAKCGVCRRCNYGVRRKSILSRMPQIGLLERIIMEV